MCDDRTHPPHTVSPAFLAAVRSRPILPVVGSATASTLTVGAIAALHPVSSWDRVTKPLRLVAMWDGVAKPLRRRRP